ncbi:MAG: DUF4891 domain-containing protein [Bacteroides sp.]|nr:DUF4891 domain-containing protein [Bacteroides sp.]
MKYIVSICILLALSFRRRAEAFTIRQEMFEGDYIAPGEQYLQLRYVPNKIK